MSLFCSVTLAISKCLDESLSAFYFTFPRDPLEVVSVTFNHKRTALACPCAGHYASKKARYAKGIVVSSRKLLAPLTSSRECDCRCSSNNVLIRKSSFLCSIKVFSLELVGIQ